MKVIVPWGVSSAGLKKLLKIWGSSKEMLEAFRKDYRAIWTQKHGEPKSNHSKKQFEADSIVEFIRTSCEMPGGGLRMPPMVAERCGIKDAKKIAEDLGVEEEDLLFDPVRAIYQILKEEGYRVCIPVD